MKKSNTEGEPKIFARSRIQSSGVRARKILCEPLVVLIFLLFSLFLMFHTFGYDSAQKNILIARTLWSDFGSHIPLIRSFSMGNNWPPEYPIFPGEPIRYHFLFYLLVGMLAKIGFRLDWALNIPSALGFTLLLFGIWTLATLLFKDKRIAVLSILFFLFNGSLSFIKFFTRQPLSFRDFPAFGPWDGGVITAFWNLNIYTNQRHLAWGFALGIWFLVWVVSSRKSILPALLWGLSIGALPYFHQPTLIIMAILMGTNFLFFPRLRLPILIAASIGLFLIAPQLLTMPKTESLSWFPGYLIHDKLSIINFLSFWFQNLGLHTILIPFGFFILPSRAKKILLPLFFLFILGNLFKFSMEVAANHKFFNFALILGNMISAYVIIRMRVPILVGILILSGLIDFFVIVNDTKGPLPDVGNNQTASWIAANTPKDAVFLNSSFLYHPASLAGRKIFLGWPYFAWSAGYDTYGRMAEMRTMYESKNPNVFCPLLKKHTISYVTVEDTKGDPNLPNIDVSYFLDNYKPAFEDADGKLRIYSFLVLCPPS